MCAARIFKRYILWFLLSLNNILKFKKKQIPSPALSKKTQMDLVLIMDSPGYVNKNSWWTHIKSPLFYKILAQLAHWFAHAISVQRIELCFIKLVANNIFDTTLTHFNVKWNNTNVRFCYWRFFFLQQFRKKLNSNVIRKRGTIKY